MTPRLQVKSVRELCPDDYGLPIQIISKDDEGFCVRHGKLHGAKHGGVTSLLELKLVDESVARFVLSLDDEVTLVVND